jgi:hypothetical protein
MKQSLEALEKQHHLPSLRQWVSVDDDCTLADVRRAFQEKLFAFAELLNMLLRPEELNAILEAQIFSEEEHQSMDKFYERIVLLTKDCLLVDIAATDEEELALLRSLIAEWPAIVSEMKRIVTKTKEAYTGTKPGAHTVSYLG